MATTTVAKPQTSVNVPSKAAAREERAPKGQGAAVPRKALLILHGKRLDDDLVRVAIQQLKSEGHEVGLGAPTGTKIGRV